MDETTASTGVVAPVTRADLLLVQELSLMSTARHYDLDDRDDRHRSHVVLSRLFLDLCTIVGIDLFVEAGALDGATSRRARKWFPDVRVVAFEANPVAYEQFHAANDAAGVEYLNLALTSGPGTVTFNLHRDEDGSPNANGQSGLLKRDKDETDRERGFVEVTVPGTTLDGFFADQPGTDAGMWIDVEGACKFVLPGALELLSRTAVLMIEVEERNYWGPDHWQRDQVVSFLYDHGFVPVARDYEFIDQYNLVFVRADWLTRTSRVRWALSLFASKAGT